RHEVLPRRRLVAAHPALGDGAARSGVRRDESAGRARPAPRRGREDGQGGVTMATMTMDASAIESVERIRAGDPEDMLGRIKELGQQIRDAWAIASKANLPPAYGDVRNITVAGMGGSAIGGDLAAALLADELKVPMTVHRDYGLPAYVGRDSLVVTSSYSGNTEETLSSFDEARKRGAGVMGVMARRVKGQWNENAKNWSAFDVMSELNHNAVVGFPHPPIAKEALTVLLLRSDRDNPRHKLRFEVTRELLDRASIPHKTLQFAGQNVLSEVLQMVYFTDYVSFYVALLNGADPSPNTSIDYLKDRLA